MILEQETFDKFGYRPSALSLKSSKVMLIQCDCCSTVFNRVKASYTACKFPNLCKHCQIKKVQEIAIAETGHTIQSRPSTLAKARETFIKNYGVDNPSKAQHIKDKKEHTFLKNFGYKTSLQDPETKKKIAQTNIVRYGAPHNSHNAGVLKKRRDTKIANGHTLTIEGRTVKEWSAEKDISVMTAYNFLRANTQERFVNTEFETDTYIEATVKNMLIRLNVPFVEKQGIGRVIPDFIVDDKLVIECDGIYWHSDKFKKDNYHSEKKKLYSKSGLASLFFYEFEIIHKLPIVESIIRNALRICDKRIYGRKCEVATVTKEEASLFMEENHLMGKGRGSAFGLFYEGKLVSVIQFYYKNKHKGIINISRFCNKLNCSVVGGYTKLLSRIIRQMQPKEIQTFVDLRYGSGEYLQKFGYVKGNCSRSFKWVKGNKIYNRMKFPGNSGYVLGFNKIWDCGQQLYTCKNKNT